MDPPRPPSKTIQPASTAAPSLSAALEPDELHCNLLDIFFNPDDAPAPPTHAAALDPLAVEYPRGGKKYGDIAKSGTSKHPINPTAANPFESSEGGTGGPPPSWFDTRSSDVFRQSSPPSADKKPPTSTQPGMSSYSAFNTTTRTSTVPSPPSQNLPSRLATLHYPATTDLPPQPALSPSRHSPAGIRKKQLDLGADACRRRRLRRVQIRRGKGSTTRWDDHSPEHAVGGGGGGGGAFAGGTVA
eukprot:CAMPEP_0174891572 /NCGR_PEP_ID=MMETSP0167-20121228/6637_1 /TAXON_ID=38298 /ORGANISM="Rhodella maculata, Strain CCMP736" /LENGTH=243 /DNA_ID=CAMNT_0016129805 /DNA_START=124 /DNA_END=852 /DNA_ORIENTATION=-